MTTTLIRPLAHLAYLGLGLTSGMTILGHVGADPRLSAIGDTISDFAAADVTGPVSIGMFLCVAASLALLAGMRKVGAPLTKLTTALMLTWSGSLLVAAIIPTDSFEVGDLSPMGYVHRYASAIAFAALLVGSHFISRSLRTDERWSDLADKVRGLTIAATVSGALMIATTYVGDRFLIGLVERGMAAFAITSLVLLSLRVLKLAEPTRLVLRPALAV